MNQQWLFDNSDLQEGRGLHSPFGNIFKFSSLSLCASIAYLILLLRALLRLLG